MRNMSAMDFKMVLTGVLGALWLIEIALSAIGL